MAGIELADELRYGMLDDIQDLMMMLQWFLRYEERHRYSVDYVNFFSTIKLLDKAVKNYIKRYEKEYQVKIPFRLLQRYINA